MIGQEALFYTQVVSNYSKVTRCCKRSIRQLCSVVRGVLSLN